MEESASFHKSEAEDSRDTEQNTDGRMPGEDEQPAEERLKKVGEEFNAVARFSDARVPTQPPLAATKACAGESGEFQKASADVHTAWGDLLRSMSSPGSFAPAVVARPCRMTRRVDPSPHFNNFFLSLAGTLLGSKQWFVQRGLAFCMEGPARTPVPMRLQGPIGEPATVAFR